MKINATTIKALDRPESGQRIVWDDTLRGFGIRLTAGAASYIAEARVNGKSRRVKIAAVGTLTPDEARRKARTKLGEMADGVDHAAVKAKQRVESITLSELSDDYMFNRRRKRDNKPLKDRSKADIKRHVEVTLKPWSHKPISTITRDMIRTRYSELCERSVAQANQSMRILSSLFNYAKATSRTPDGERIIRDNPVEVLSDANLWREVKARDNAVPSEKLGEWWSAVQAFRSDMTKTPASRTAADFIAFLALTGLRKTEAAAVRWVDVDKQAGTLSLTDTKNRSDVVLPLSTQALEIITARRKVNSYVFPGRSKVGHIGDVRATLTKINDKSGVGVTFHDLRRTFIRTGTRDLSIELYRIKRLSNHAIPAGDVTQAHYLGADATWLRSEAQAIADHYDQQAAAAEGDNVVPFRAVSA